ncbi:MAG TPA: type IV pilus secretin PilQ, partial [Idiomarina sp.]|nr:type IV pilus secretin PilQ [Idiomarina sp.]
MAILRTVAPITLLLGGIFATTVSIAKDNAWYSLLSEQQRQQKVNLNLTRVGLSEALQILADQLQLNLIVADDITGSTNLKLKDVSWLDAMTSLSKTHGIFIHLQNNVLWVSKSGDNPSEPEERKLELVSVNFAAANELAELITQNGQNLSSHQGSITVDERTNTLIINDTEKHRQAIKQLVAELDRPVRQVMIEARMVSLKTNLAKEFGVRWGASSSGLEATTVDDTNFIHGMQISAPVVQPHATVGLNVARLSDDLLLDLELTALEHENKGEIIASPKIFTANQQPAFIEQGTEIPYVESAASGATAVQFKKAVMGLRVTPKITPNNHVLLDLTITQNTRGDTVSTPTGPAVAIDTQEMGTQVLVKNGETIVLGGI